MNEAKSNILYISIAVGVLIAVVAGFYFWQKTKTEEPEPSATEALEKVENAAPEVGVPTSPIENKIPDLNPVEQTNPFKYENPLR